jgi:hypothetical protein
MVVGDILAYLASLIGELFHFLDSVNKTLKNHKNGHLFGASQNQTKNITYYNTLNLNYCQYINFF